MEITKEQKNILDRVEKWKELLPDFIEEQCPKGIDKCRGSVTVNIVLFMFKLLGKELI